MQEIDAVKAFYECCKCDDLVSAKEILRFISTDTINRQDEDDYDMLIQAVQNEDACMVEALLESGRADVTHRENLCGRTAVEFALDYGTDSRIFQAFNNNPRPDFIYRNGEVIPKEEIFSRIMDGKLEADDGCATMIKDSQVVELLLKDKICREDFEEWMTPDGIDAEAQFALLTADPEYGQKWVSWDFLRAEGELSDWEKLTEKHPQFSKEAPSREDLQKRVDALMDRLCVKFNFDD